jgi:putative aldouronate transport system permease protein
MRASRLNRRIGNLIIGLLLVAMFVIWAFPFYYVVIIAFMPYGNYMRQSFHLLPSGFTLAYLANVFSDTEIVRAYLNSFARTLIGAGCSVLLTAMSAYVLTKRNLKLYRVLNLFILIPMFFRAGMVPFYLVIKNLGLIDHFASLILPFLFTSYYLILMKNFMMMIPASIEESALIDGANNFQIFSRIVLPISKSGLAVIGVLYGTFHWNEFFWTGILINHPNLYTITVELRNVFSRSIEDTRGFAGGIAPGSLLAAIALLIIIPVLVMYPFVQRYFTKGLLLGAIKG